MAAPQPDERLLVRVRHLVLAALASGAVSVLVLQGWRSRGGDLPTPSWLFAALLLVLAVTVAMLGLRLRRLVRSGDVLDGTGATRTLVLGQSTAATAALVGGYAAALVTLSLTRLDAPEPRRVLLLSALALGAAIAAAAAGLLTQWCCRVPPTDDDAQQSL